VTKRVKFNRPDDTRCALFSVNSRIAAKKVHSWNKIQASQAFVQLQSERWDMEPFLENDVAEDAHQERRPGIHCPLRRELGGRNVILQLPFDKRPINEPQPLDVGLRNPLLEVCLKG
jgi:hypothetical protein